jgi:hypothetical protein
LGLFASAAVPVFALWLPLILLHPDIFRVQFGGNVLNRAGPGLGATLLAPWSILAYQLGQVVEFVQPIQAGLYAIALAWGTVAGWARPETRDFVFHLWASWLLLFLFEGRHPTLGYYAYPAALTSIALGMFAARIADRLEAACRGRLAVFRATVPWLVFGLVLLGFLPGAGLRTLLVHLRHPTDPAYDAHAVARAVMRDLPPRAPAAVDGAYVLDFYLAGRPVLDATIHRLSYDFRTRDYDYVVFSRAGMKRFLPMMNDLTLIRTYGDETDPFASHAALYRRTRPPDPSPMAEPARRSPGPAAGPGLPSARPR